MQDITIENINDIKVLINEFELEKASVLALRLRGDKSHALIRKKLINLIKCYEEKYWSDINSISNDQIKESDTAQNTVEKESLDN